MSWERESFVFYSVILESSKQKSLLLFDMPGAFLRLDMNKLRFSMLFTGAAVERRLFKRRENTTAKFSVFILKSSFSHKDCTYISRPRSNQQHTLLTLVLNTITKKQCYVHELLQLFCFRN